MSGSRPIRVYSSSWPDGLGLETLRAENEVVELKLVSSIGILECLRS